MCFLLFVGTSKPLPRKSWEASSPDINVESLTDQESPVKNAFWSSEVQFVGSTSGCGCDFPNVMYQNGGWPMMDDEPDAETFASDQLNREGFFKLIQTSNEKVVEVYGVWAGDEDKEPMIREVIQLARILDSDFHFKERGFLSVHCSE